MIVIVMGVSGCGKTTIGKKLAEATNGKFFDGDDFHPPANVAKMHSGHALTDEDRLPWLNRLRTLIVDQKAKDEPTFIACSALKKSYREILTDFGKDTSLQFVFLEGSFSLIEERLQERTGHFMPESLLKSQFETLQEPEDAIVADISKEPDEVVANIIPKLKP